MSRGSQSNIDAAVTLQEKTNVFYQLLDQQKDGRETFQRMLADPGAAVKSLSSLAESPAEEGVGGSSGKKETDDLYERLQRMVDSSPSLKKALVEWKLALMGANRETAPAALCLADMAPAENPGLPLFQTQDRTFTRAMNEVRVKQNITAAELLEKANGKFEQIKSIYPDIHKALAGITTRVDWSDLSRAIEKDLLQLAGEPDRGVDLSGRPELQKVFGLFDAEVKKTHSEQAAQADAGQGDSEQKQVPETLLSDVRFELLNCEEFNSFDNLMILFKDERINRWQNIVPTNTNRTNLVEYTISTLIGRQNETGENALVLTLQVLADKDRPSESIERLRSLSDRLEKALSEEGASLKPEPTALEAQQIVPTLKDLLLQTPLLSEILWEEHCYGLIGDGTMKIAALQALEHRIRIARHFLQLRKFAKLSSLDFRWPDLGWLIRDRPSDLEQLEGQLAEHIQLTPGSPGYALWDHFKNDSALAEFFQLQPNFEEIAAQGLAEYLTVSQAIQQVQPQAGPVAGGGEKLAEPALQPIIETPQYDDLEINFHPEGDGHYRILLTLGATTQRATLDLPEEFPQLWNNQAEQHAVSLIEKPDIDLSSRLVDLGTEISKTVFRDELRSAFLERLNQAMKSERRTRIILNIEGQELLRVPWEYLFFQEFSGFLALQPKFSLIRRITTTKQPMVPTNLTRLLMVYPEVKDATQFQVEKNQLISMLQGLHNIEFRLISEEEATYIDLRVALYEFNPHLVHFQGRTDNNQKQGEISLEVRPFVINDLLNMFSSTKNMALLVLNTNMLDPNNLGWIPGLLRSGVLALVCATVPLSTATATRFSRSFYRSLSDGKPLEEALLHARSTLNRNKMHWPSYALYTIAPRELETIRLAR